jgi:hypothetical protein
MEEAEAAEFAAGFGAGPGPEDLANGRAALAAAVLREASVWAATGASLRTALSHMPGPGGGPSEDVRRHRLGTAAASDAALKAALLVETAEALGAPGALALVAGRMAAAAQRAGVPVAGLAGPVRAAALRLGTDDGAARMTAAALAQELAGLLV